MNFKKDDKEDITDLHTRCANCVHSIKAEVNITLRPDFLKPKTSTKKITRIIYRCNNINGCIHET